MTHELTRREKTPEFAGVVLSTETLTLVKVVFYFSHKCKHKSLLSECSRGKQEIKTEDKRINNRFILQPEQCIIWPIYYNIILWPHFFVIRDLGSQIFFFSIYLWVWEIF